MSRYRLTVAYDGTAYHGWQEQANSITIESVLNETLSNVLKEEIHVIGASRTDAGVHAYGNVAVFDSETRIPPEKIAYAVNPHLPSDIRIMRSEEVPADFHPRFTDSVKTYEYHIYRGRIMPPTRRLYAHQVPVPLDLEAMAEACRYIVGTHDFACFCAAKAQVNSTVRTVLDVQVHPGKPGAEEEIIIEVKGEGFLYNMVRIIVGTLLKVGVHAYPPEHVREIIESKDRREAGETVPAKGLFLREISYTD
ncbi:MAG: tRNA pseudouridine(38-40) synthase TruA [Eubacterium sp.]|nr:tRNA pseudouridine(38-40) synthase TruA [Eubacterium sp.]